MAKKKWTMEDINALKEMAREKLPIKIISYYFEVTPNAVSKALQRYCEGYANQIYKKVKTEKLIVKKKQKDYISKWIDYNYEKFRGILKKNNTRNQNIFFFNKILYENNIHITDTVVIQYYLSYLLQNYKVIS